MNAVQLRQIVATRLHPGDSSKRITDFYAEYHIDYSFDRDLMRYEAFYPLPKEQIAHGHTLQVYIYVDKDGRFLRAEIMDSYTGL